MLPYLLPPLVGAVIGYITNAVAITMLFRPHNKKKVGVCTIPFTPGIIPKQRYELADKIAALVSKELLTEDAVRKQISSPGVAKGVSDNIAFFTDYLLNTPINKLSKVTLGYFSQELSDTSGTFLLNGPKTILTLESLILELINRFTQTVHFKKSLGVLIDLGVEEAGKLTLQDILPQGFEKIREYICREEQANFVEKKIRETVIYAVRRNLHIGDLLSTEGIESLLEGIDRLYPKITPRLLELLDDPGIKSELEKRGKVLLASIIKKLNSFQRFLVTAAQYDRTLAEHMDEIVEDAIDALRRALYDRNSRVKLIRALRVQLNKARNLSMGDLVAAWGPSFEDDLNYISAMVAKSIPSFGNNPGAVGFIDNLWAGVKDYNVNDAFQNLTGWNENEVKSLIKKYLLNESDKNEFPFFKQLSILITSQGEYSLQDIFAISEGLKTDIDRKISSAFLQLVHERVPDILDHIDVEVLVIDKINSLEIAKVETLILMVVKTQLRWINFFGAFLGAIIGSVQVILNFIL